jgi:hypothetical protein
MYICIYLAKILDTARRYAGLSPDKGGLEAKASNVTLKEQVLSHGYQRERSGFATEQTVRVIDTSVSHQWHITAEI